MAKKKNVTKHATNVNNNRNEVHIHLGDKKKRAKKRKAVNPRSSHPYASQFSSQIPQPLTPQFYVNRSQQFDPMTQSQRETILGQVPVPVTVPVPVPIPVPVHTPVPIQVKTEVVETPVPHAPSKIGVPIPTNIQRGAFTSPLPPVKLFYDHIPKSQNYDPTYNDIYENDSQFSMHKSDVFKPPHQPIVRDHMEKMYDADMESDQSDKEESNYPSVGTAGAFNEQTPYKKKTRNKVDVSQLTPSQLEQRRKKLILNKKNNQRAKSEKNALRLSGVRL